MLPRFFFTVLPLFAAIAGDAELQAYSASRSQQAAQSDAAFVNVGEVEIPIFGNGRIEGRMNAHVILQMANARAAGAATKRMPEFRTHIVESMLAYGSLYVSGFAPVDAEGLSATLNAEVKVHGKGVRRVLIVALSATPA